METHPDAAHLPHFELRGPTTGPLLDRRQVDEFRRWALGTTAVTEPAVLVVDLEGRFPTSAVLHELIVGFARTVQSGEYGPIVLVVATPDLGVREVLRALAGAHQVPLYLAESARAPWQAEPALALSPAERETLDLVAGLGGRVTVSQVADATGLDHTAAGNRLASLDRRQMLMKLSRAPRYGHLYIDPRAGRARSGPTGDPTGLPLSS